MGGGHGGMGMKRITASEGASADGDAEQMALVATYIAPL
jgi:hypothetical protein